MRKHGLVTLFVVFGVLIGSLLALTTYTSAQAVGDVAPPLQTTHHNTMSNNDTMIPVTGTMPMGDMSQMMPMMMQMMGHHLQMMGHMQNMMNGTMPMTGTMPMSGTMPMGDMSQMMPMMMQMMAGTMPMTGTMPMSGTMPMGDMSQMMPMMMQMMGGTMPMTGTMHMSGTMPMGDMSQMMPMMMQMMSRMMPMSGDMMGMGSSANLAPLGKGFYEGEEVQFIHTEASDPDVAQLLTEMMGPEVVLVPELAETPSSLLANVYVFTNGVEGNGPFGFQPDVFDAVPGDAGYRPLRAVQLVSWPDESEPRLLNSVAEIEAAADDGEIAIEQSGAVVNMPILVWPGGQR